MTNFETMNLTVLEAIRKAASPFPAVELFNSFDAALELLENGTLFEAVWGNNFEYGAADTSAPWVDTLPYLEVVSLLMFMGRKVNDDRKVLFVDMGGEIHELDVQGRRVHVMNKVPLASFVSKGATVVPAPKMRGDLKADADKVADLPFSAKAVKQAVSILKLMKGFRDAGDEDVIVIGTLSRMVVGLVAFSAFEAPIEMGNYFSIEPFSMDWGRAQIGATELRWALEHLHIPTQDVEGGFSFVLEGTPWIHRDGGLWYGDKRMRPILSVYNTGMEDVAPEHVFPTTPEMTFLRALLCNIRSLSARTRLMGEVQKSLLNSLSWDTSHECGKVEEERDWFLSQTFKAAAWEVQLPFVPVKGKNRLAVSENIRIASKTFEQSHLDRAIFAHNLVHLHKDSCEQMFNAELVMFKLCWVPVDQRRAVLLSTVSNILDVEATETAVVEALTKKGLFSGSATKVLQDAEENLVVLLSTKENKLTKRIALEYPNACEVLGKEVNGVFVPGAASKRLRRPGQEKSGTGVEIRALFAPYLPLPAGMAYEVGRVSVLHRDVIGVKAEMPISKQHGFRVVADPDFAMIDRPNGTWNARITWSRPVAVRRGETLIEVPFVGADGTVHAYPVTAEEGGEIAFIEITETEKGKAPQIIVRGEIHRTERETKLRSLCKMMTGTLPNGAEVLHNGANPEHPEFGALSAEYIIPSDADKSEAMAFWKLESALQTAAQKDEHGAPLFPTLAALCDNLFAAQGLGDGVVSPLAIATGATRPICEEFERIFGQNVWLSFVDSVLEGPEDGNFISALRLLLSEKIRANSLKGGGVEGADDFQAHLAQVSHLVGDANTTVIATGSYTRDGVSDWSNVFVFWVDAEGRQCMAVRTFCFVGWEKAPLVKVEKVEALSVARAGSNVVMGSMAGTIRGVNLAGDRAFAKALSADMDGHCAKVSALTAMRRNAGIRKVGEESTTLPIVLVGNDTFSAPEVRALIEENRAENTVLEALAAAFPDTVFRFVTGESENDTAFTVWFPAVVAMGGATGFKANESMAGMLSQAITRLALGQKTDSEEVRSCLRRAFGMLRSLVDNKGLLKSVLVGRPGVQCKTISSLGVPAGVFLVRYASADEFCFDTSMYGALTKMHRSAGGTSGINGQKFLVSRAPLTFPIILKAKVVFPGDALWLLVEDRPHVVACQFWTALEDRGDCDGDGRTHVPAFDSKLPVLTFAKVLEGLYESSGISLAEIETYIGDQLKPGVRESGRSSFGMSHKALKTSSWCGNVFTRATKFNKNFGAGHQAYMFADIINEVILSTVPANVVSSVSWASPRTITVAAETYETTLGGLDPHMEVIISQWLAPTIYGAALSNSKLKKQADAALISMRSRIEKNGAVSVPGHFSEAGLNEKVLGDIVTMVNMGGVGSKMKDWCKEVSFTKGWLFDDEPKKERMMPWVKLDPTNMAILVAMLTHSLSKGLCSADWMRLEEDENGESEWGSAPQGSLPNLDWADYAAEVGWDALEGKDLAQEKDVLSNWQMFSIPSNGLLAFARFMDAESPLCRLICSRYDDSPWIPMSLQEKEASPVLSVIRKDQLQSMRAASVSMDMLLTFIEKALPAVLMSRLEAYDVEADLLCNHPKVSVTEEVVQALERPTFVLEEQPEFASLSADQAEAVEAILAIADPDYPAANDVFLTGGPGSGKSFTLGVALQLLERKYGARVNVQVCGTTGPAAENISNERVSARTINSAFGIGSTGSTLPSSMKDGDLRGFRPRPTTVDIARKSHIAGVFGKGEVLLVVIDEISMASSELLFLIDEVARACRTKQGVESIRYVFVGDLDQLPVVNKEDETFFPATNNPIWKNATFIERAGRTITRPSMFGARTLMCTLTNVHRQADKQFVAHMRRVGKGLVPTDTAEYLAGFTISDERPRPENAIHIFPDNRSVGDTNRAAAEKAREAGARFMTVRALVNTEVASPEHARGWWVPQISPMGLVQEFYMSAPVQFRQNDLVNNLFANGTTGTIVDMDEKKYTITVRLDRNAQVITVGRRSLRLEQNSEGTRPPAVEQIPAVIAAAMTGHKVQGQTIDRPIIVHVPYNLSRAKGNWSGWVYVAMTRVRDPKTQLFLKGRVSDIVGSITAGQEYREEISTFISELTLEDGN